MIKEKIEFILNDQPVELQAFAPDAMLLDFLREQKRLVGTKEGCGEGDCGACTILIGQIEDGELHYHSVNACIQFLAPLNAKHVITIEGIANGGLRPLQEAMVKYHGSQCGFCTPGIMMSLFALFMRTSKPDIMAIETALQGNLCRCTGYEPIIKAALSISGDIEVQSWLKEQRFKIVDRLTQLDSGADIAIHSEAGVAHIPQTETQLAKLLATEHGNTIIAGATDVGLWVNKHFRQVSPAIFLEDIQTLKRMAKDGELDIGSGVSYAKAQEFLANEYPAFRELFHRIGGAQIRNKGTIGGNIANGSPIGDLPPALIAMGAEIELVSIEGKRKLPLEDFFITYGQQNIRENEYLSRIKLPLCASGMTVKFYKISKRQYEDISSVMVAIALRIEDGIIGSARICYGGMAGIPKRAISVENELLGAPWKIESFANAAKKIKDDFSPLSDVRASAEYRMLVAQNLLIRFFHDHNKMGDDDGT